MMNVQQMNVPPEVAQRWRYLQVRWTTGGWTLETQVYTLWGRMDADEQWKRIAHRMPGDVIWTLEE